MKNVKVKKDSLIMIVILVGLVFIGLMASTKEKTSVKENVILPQTPAVSENVLVQKYDLVIIDVDGTIDGAAFEGGTADTLTTLIGAGQMIPGFEDQIIGHSVGDVFDVVVTFPNDYGEESLNGKQAVFKTTLHEIWRNVSTDLGEGYYDPKN